ncbi:p-hydroxybenzoate 3-monooxygenase [Hamadaea flava]|uniref:4-hydroxybenzoate 3-monooxygenase n=1 Tax=Hamadaea flava TaxID=1742688 RepID=A0ABV8LX01_9ACTN|nr:4-hydroxybenzoate 3-monooxygenase [Hamadaea flava]MCP2328824.1 p-hydroxybenzoate 3-monooxygenase [Hamadaea flava]
MRTQVGIVGAGPAGLVLAHLLHLNGIDSVVVERQTRDHVEKRIRAGVLEHGTVDLLTAAGLGDRLLRERMVHHGVELLFDRVGHRVPLTELTGREITIYGQHELVKDLISARLDTERPLHFEAADVQVDGTELTFHVDGTQTTVECDFIAGCDGFHGISRAGIPPSALTVFEREYPHAWLGVLAQAPPASDELVYAYHDRGFALHSMRTPDITRLYLQVPADTDAADWPDARIWDELRTRLDRDDPRWQLNEGPILEKSVAAMRSFVVTPMQHEQLFLAGDAAHIVPPTGAKGLNLAVADVAVLAEGFAEYYAGRGSGLLRRYSETCLRRVWRVQHFSWWMTSMLHRVDDDPFTRELQLSQLRYVTSSTAAATTLAENYVGFPMA